MHDFILREIHNTDIETELNRIGFDKSYAHRAASKFEYKNIKIYDLTPGQANILKQTAISAGCDCATHREVITGKIEKSDCILTGSLSQIKKVGEKLKFQPFGLKNLGLKLIEMHHYEEFESSNSEVIQLLNYDNRYKLDCFGGVSMPPHNDETVSTCAKNMASKSFASPNLVGILNLTENSFSDGGLYNNFESASKHLLEMINDGADIIDIGAESTKPYSKPVLANEQLKKLLPIIEFAKEKTTISIDTRSAKVAEKCLKAGANIINDVSGLDYDSKMADIIAKYNCPVIIQHSKGTPENMQDSPHYYDVMEEIFLELHKKIQIARSKGIENIIIDPGIGFGKTRENNLEIIKRVKEFRSLGYPIMLGISRKSFLGDMDDAYTLAFNALAIERKVDYIRVHNVKMHKHLIDLMNMFVVE